MYAVLIDPVSEELSKIELNDHDKIASVIGFETIISDEISGSTDLLHFDENCFIRGTPGRFQLDALPPVAGKAIVLGTGANGDSQSPELAIETLKQRIKFISDIP